jgi:hypothetical protein
MDTGRYSSTQAAGDLITAVEGSGGASTYLHHDRQSTADPATGGHYRGVADLARYFYGAGDEVSGIGLLLELAAGGHPEWYKDAACWKHPELDCSVTLLTVSRSPSTCAGLPACAVWTLTAGRWPRTTRWLVCRPGRQRRTAPSCVV